MAKQRKIPLELYIHIPFCARKCFYCDFLSFRTLAKTHEAYIRQLLREIRALAPSCRDYQAVTIFVGGGTPSVLEPELICQVMEAVCRNFDVAPEAEISIEVNPGTLLHNKLALYRQAGFNRVSIGLQSAANEELRNLGRIHSFEEFLKSFQSARMAGFQNINVDLMSGIPGQTMESWKNTLKKVTMLKPEHISSYSLIIEEGTPYWDRYGNGGNRDKEKEKRERTQIPEKEDLGLIAEPAELGKRSLPPLPDEDTENKMYHLTRQFLKEQGFVRYEVPNYARPGFECRHNVGYWTGTEYLGLGLGSSSYMAGYRFCNERGMERYLNLDFEGADWQECLHPQIQRLTRQDKMEEFMFLGLRMTKGISEIDFVSAFGVKLESVYGKVISQLIANGLLKREGTRLALTEWGMDVSNFVLSEFLLGD